MLVWDFSEKFLSDEVGDRLAVKGVMVRGECAHPPAPIPRHLKALSAIQVFCLSLAESQIFLKVWIYDFHIINKAKIKCFFPQCHREQGSVFL